MNITERLQAAALQTYPAVAPVTYVESDDEPTWRDVTVTPLRESPSYVYQGDQHSDEFVYLVGPAGELNPSDELCAAVEAVLAKICDPNDTGLDFEDVETDLSHALERYRGRK